MDGTDAITSETAEKLLARSDPLKPDEVAKLLRYLKRANDDVVNRMRQLKNEVGRAARH